MNRCLAGLLTFVLLLVFGVSFSVLALDDEPDELNWDRLGGTQTGFRHFCDYVQTHSDYRQELLSEESVREDGRSMALPDEVATIWVSPEAFAGYKGSQWGQEICQERSVLTYPPGHGGGHTRAKVTIPQSGFYRLWAEYYHEQGTVASFIVRLEDPVLASVDNMFQTVVQDVFLHKYDFAEYGRRSNPLPNRREEATGFLWEGSPLVWLDAGERTITLTGTIHDGPFGSRRVASIVLTQEPLALPVAPEGSGPVRIGHAKASNEAAAVAAIWERRPVMNCTNKKLVALWSQWRTTFLNELADSKIEGLQGQRMAALVAFDPDTNLIGTPRQIRDEKKRMSEFFKTFSDISYIDKLEGEDFSTGQGWWVDGHSDASGGNMLVTGYGDGLAESECTLELPRDGAYRFWSRYMELPGYLSEFRLIITGANNRTEEIVFCNNEEENRTSPGFRWKCITVNLPAGTCRLKLHKLSGPGATYRRFDCLIVTDSPTWQPERQGEIVAPYDESGELQVWRASDPWSGFSRLSVPRADEGLQDMKVELPLGGTESFLILLRNGSKEAKTICPEIDGDVAGLLTWRVPAFVLSPQFGWQPMPLLERSSLTVPAGETAAIWLTLDGTKKSQKEEIIFRVAGREQKFLISRKGNLNRAPVPLVGGWSAPYETVSCWETFSRLGLNVINDVIVPISEAKKYKIKLFLRLNDGDVSREHIAAVAQYFREYGIPAKSWAWSFMDEPGSGASDDWVKLAQKFQSVNRSIRIWCNPGEIEGAPAESNLKMLPYVDCYCPYANHYWTKGQGNETYFRELSGQGRDYALRLTYTTPCGTEKSPGAPRDMFGPVGPSIEYNLDGWMFYALLGRYEYCNSVWDEVNQFHGDQSVNLYPGAAGRTLSTRNAEAIREAVDWWQTSRLEQKSGAKN
ncbi:MAG: hypothetical protein Q4G68_12145 [Planctomycetia bacterium]|nr:hypothetical protein [Planctomycetia bacterium]